MNNWIVYQHLFPNGKSYIGITSTSLQTRSGQYGQRYKEQPLMMNAINKYGWENIQHLVLEANLTMEEAHQKEQEYIKYFHSYYLDPDGPGYNMTRGGEGALKTDPAEVEHLYKQGYTTYQIAELLNIDRGGVSRILRGLNYDLQNNTHKAINQFDLNGKYIATYSSAVEAERITKIDRKLISGVVRNKAKSTNGFQWRYYNEDDVKNGIPPINRQHGGAEKKPIQQYDLNNNYIKTFDSIAEAALETGATRANIRSAAQGKIKTSMGYKWKFVEDD